MLREAALVFPALPLATRPRICNCPAMTMSVARLALSVALGNPMNLVRFRVYSQFIASVTALALVASTVAAAPEKPIQQPLPIDSAPKEIRDYLAAAKAADKIADPLARCLAFPDFPGNQWPKGLGEQHCKLNFGPHITREQIQGLLDSNDVAALDQLFAADLAKHFSNDGFPEVIHQDYAPFDATYESGKQSKVWLDKAPNSAFAMVARAEYFREMAWTARGSKWGAETPKENLQRMSEFADKAIALYQSALKIEPKMVQAYSGLLNIGMLDSQSQLMVDAFDRMQKIDPACRSFAMNMMSALTPRWGGSEEKMLAYAQDLSSRQAQRPLLSLYTVAPMLDAADTFQRAERDAERVKTLASAVPLSSNAEVYTDLASAEMDAPSEDAWKPMLHLIAASRFQDGDTWANSTRGAGKIRYLHDAEWALADLERATKDPTYASHGHYWLGNAYAVLARYDDAEKEYLLSLDGTEGQIQTLYDLTRAMLAAKHFAKARQYNDRHIKEFPDDPWAWYLRPSVLSAGGDVSGDKLAMLITPMEKFMALSAGSEDTRLVPLRAGVQRDLDMMRKIQKLPVPKP